MSIGFTLIGVMFCMSSAELPAKTPDKTLRTTWVKVATENGLTVEVADIASTANIILPVSVIVHTRA